MAGVQGVPVIPDKYRALLEPQIDQMLKDMDDEASWRFHAEKHGIKGYTRIEDSLTAAKGVGRVAFNPRAVWDLIMDVERKHTFDRQLLEGKRLATLDAQTNIDYLSYKSPAFFVAGRDFLSIVHWRVQPNGDIIVVAQSVEDLELCPLKEPKIVRGHIHIGGWRIVPDADYKSCEVTFVVKTDLKGSIPARVAGAAASEQPYLIHEIAEVLKKDKDIARFDALGKVVNTGGAKDAEATTTSDAA
jgi:hypothetical protein